ncbi:MAG: phosphoenolpyruvate carboxykinase (GTP) [archaeon]|nr:phosphoenolpyruvate carboxykinase (GTP) [archaeon]
MSVLNEIELKKLKDLKNEHVINMVNEYIELLTPKIAYVITDSDEDVKFVKQQAITKGEESPLNMKGHTIHYDSYYDQARDKGNTKILVTPDQKMSKRLNQIDRDEGLKEILSYMKGAMKNKEMIIRCFVLGPENSEFSQYALQITDSWYVAHSEDILYRKGYEQFKKLNGSKDFFLFVHTAGELDGNVTKKELIDEKRRIYVDLKGNKVLSCYNQYAGNSLGLKKLALRLAIYKSNLIDKDWLTEHMFIMGLHPKGKNRVTFVAGAYPSACGKTSTAMVPGQSIVGDDIAYLRNIDGECRGVNIEKGVFGIIRDVNPADDPVIYKTITSERELIYSNVLINNERAYWLGMGEELPNEGMNHTGKEWVKGNKDEKGNIITHSHPNARYTVGISELENADPHLNDPKGVKIQGLFYGGRDSDTNVPIYQSLNWEHGIYIGATIESETTSATLGKVGIRKSSPMANLDFIVVPLNTYFDNHRKFGNLLGEKVPKVFATNYFLKNSEGKYSNEKVDKKVWLLWAEGRIQENCEFDAIKTPIGYLPKYDDLKELFKSIFNREYTEDEYIEQFSIRTDKLLEKVGRMEQIFEEEGVSQFLLDILKEQGTELKKLKEKYGKEKISPFEI